MRLAALLGGITLGFLAEAGKGLAQGGDELKALNFRVIELYEAGSMRKRSRLPRNMPKPSRRARDDESEYAVALDNLAQLLQATNRLAEAEPLMRRALAIDEKSFGPETIPTSPSASTTWRSCCRPPTGWPRPSR